jgi:MATE family multidrug resistance protein
MHVAPTTELKAILRLAGPLIASQLAHMLMVLTDTLMMARISPRPWPVAAWGQPVIRSCRSSAWRDRRRRHAGGHPSWRQRHRRRHPPDQNGLWLAWAWPWPAGAVEPQASCCCSARPKTCLGRQFLTMLPFALPGYLTFMALRGFTSAIGKATPVMVISLVGTVLNYLLNHALIEGMFGLPKLGLMGIGLVTAVVSMGMAVALMLYIRWHRPTPPTRCARACRAHHPVLRELWRLGLPIGGTYMVEVGLFAFAALCMGVLGSTELAAHQIALQIVSVAFMVPAGLSYAVTMRVGQHYGAGNLLRRAGRAVGIGFGAAVMLALPRCSCCCRKRWSACSSTTTTRPSAIFQLAVQPADGGRVVRAVRRRADHRHGLRSVG